jgi:hypothetical protein
LIAIICLGYLSSPPHVASSVPPDSVARCAPCHHRPGNDQVGEWLASPYSEVVGGRGCSDCHGPCRNETGAGATRNRGAAVADPSRPEVPATLSVTAVCSADGIEAEVVVSNLGSGHDLPTGPDGRTLVLEVTAEGRDRSLLPCRARPLSPGSSRRIFVQHPPAGTSATQRSRLAPFETDVSRHRFSSPGREPARVNARLVLVQAGAAPREIASAASVCRPATDDSERNRDR